MKFESFIGLAVMLAWGAAAQAESVYKLKDASGATVYSDRPNLPGTTNAGTVELAPGPSVEEQQAADRKVKQMGTEADRLRQSRMGRERDRNDEPNRNAETVDDIESSGVGVVERHPRLDPKRRIPNESPDGGEHPVYEPGNGRPVQVTPHPSPRAGRR